MNSLGSAGQSVVSEDRGGGLRRVRWEYQKEYWSYLED